MDGIAITTARRPRRDWAAWSLADLIILVAGCAVTMSLPWMQNPWVQVKVWVGQPAPAWYLPLLITNEVLTKSALALLPLALWKRAQLGGVIRPGEFLLAVVTAPLLATLVGRLDWVRNSSYQAELPDNLGSYWIAGGPFWYIHLAAVAVFAASMLALIFKHKQMPAWTRSTLLISAYLGAVPWIMEGLGELLEAHVFPALIPLVPITSILTLGFTASIALELTPVVIAMAALLDRLRGRTASPLEWIGSAIGLAALTLNEFMSAHLILFNRTSAIEGGDVAQHVGMPLLTWVLGLVVAWRLGPPLGRWLGAGEAVDGPPSRLDRPGEIA